MVQNSAVLQNINITPSVTGHHVELVGRTCNSFGLHYIIMLMHTNTVNRWTVISRCETARCSVSEELIHRVSQDMQIYVIYDILF